MPMIVVVACSRAGSERPKDEDFLDPLVALYSFSLFTRREARTITTKEIKFISLIHQL